MSSCGLFIEKQLSHSRTSSNPACDEKAWCEYAVFLTSHVVNIVQHYCCLVRVLNVFCLRFCSFLFLAKNEKIAVELKSCCSEIKEAKIH